jgi:broad specificity phosphatase PhoE
MPVFLHLVRHAQGFHNLPPGNEKLADPDLTTVGRKQCQDLRAIFPYHDQKPLLVASPLRRTLETCLQSFYGADMAPVMAVPELQEISLFPCDIGSEVDVLNAQYHERVDMSRVQDGWNDKTAPGSPWQPKKSKLQARAKAARRSLRELARGRAAKAGGEGDVHVVAVSHGGFLHFVTDDWHGIPDDRGVCHAPLPCIRTWLCFLVTDFLHMARIISH